MTTDQQKLIPLSILNSIYIIFNCSVASFLVCCCAVWAAGTYSSKNESAWAGKRKYSMCQSTRGQCKIPLTVIHPTNLPPTWNNSHKTCCRLPICGGWDLITEGEKDHSLLTRDGGDGPVWPFSRDPTLISEERTSHLHECVFRRNNITNSAGKLIKEKATSSHRLC